MSGPQLENGYAKIANEILDALAAYRIPGEQMQCLLFIIRKTYGYGKKEDSISNNQFCEATGLKKGNVCRALKELSKKQLVIKNDNKKIPSYRFNKYYGQWRLLSKKQPVINITTKVIKNDNKVLSKVMDTKESKETIQKKRTNSRGTALASRNSPTWESYSTAFEKKYGSPPPRNKKQNSLIKQFVERIGLEESPSVISFYVNHRMALYIRSGHCLDLAVRDAEKLRTEWATGRQTTETGARQQDRMQTTAGIVDEIIRERENGRK